MPMSDQSNLFKGLSSPKFSRNRRFLIFVFVVIASSINLLQDSSSLLPPNLRGFIGVPSRIFTEEGVDLEALEQIEDGLGPTKSFFLRPFSRTLNSEYDKSEILELPEYIKGFANVWHDQIETDQPLFWVVPGGKATDTIVTILSQCINLVLAGVVKESQVDEPLKILPNEDGTARYVNVQTTTVPGLKRAKDLNLAGSGIANIILTKQLSDSSMLFDGDSSRGRIFTVFSHPVRRIVHNYYEVTRDPKSKDYDDEIAAMSLLEYAQSDKIVDNVITRSLVNDFHSPKISSDQIAIAKDIIRRKFLVGISEWLESSITRIEKHFEWFEKTMNESKVSSCHFHQIYKKASHLLLYPTPEWNHFVSDILFERNEADIELYKHARHIFLKQRSLM